MIQADEDARDERNRYCIAFNTSNLIDIYEWLCEHYEGDEFIVLIDTNKDYNGISYAYFIDDLENLLEG